MEQMMRGKLVIVSDIGGLGEVVDRAGLKFPAGNVPALTSCLERVLNSPSLAGEIGLQARQRALALFSQGTMVERHVNVYEQVLRNEG
jgi:glycosyltransferase involved in cell wall biosynthesis